jgi:hypothetical protein
MTATSPVRLELPDRRDQPVPSPELARLYRGFERELLVPLWTEIGDVMPASPRPAAVPHAWRWQRLLELARWPASWCRSVGAASGGPSRWPTRAWVAAHSPPRRSGRQSNT